MADEDADRFGGGDFFPSSGQDAPPLPRDVSPPLKAPDLVRTARPEPESFRRSEATFAGQIARAVARGQRVL